MKAKIAIMVAVAAPIVLACGGNKAVEIDPNAKPVGARWNAVLTTPPAMAGAVQVKGTAWMEPDEGNPQQTRASVSVSNAVPGGEHPWHVHVGRCGMDQGILGPATAYGMLKVTGEGVAEGDATIPVAMPRAGQYFVNVHASKENMGTIVACGNFAPPERQ
jgi:hypothetical protein